MERSSHKRSHIRSIALIHIDTTRYLVVGSRSHGSEVCFISLRYELVVRHEFNSDGETDESRNNGMELPVRSGQPVDEAIRLCDDEEVRGDVLCGVFVGAGGRAQHQVSELQAEEGGRSGRGDEPGLVVCRYADWGAGGFGAFV